MTRNALPIRPLCGATCGPAPAAGRLPVTHARGEHGDDGFRSGCRKGAFRDRPDADRSTSARTAGGGRPPVARGAAEAICPGKQRASVPAQGRRVTQGTRRTLAP
jgi:hypothetical protein